MADYFLVHDRNILEQQLRPALAAAWRQRSFAPCLAVCREWKGAANDYARRYHVNPDGILLFEVEQALTFDRGSWRSLAGELLLFGACEVPEIPRHVDTLLPMFALASDEDVPRPQRSAIHQSLFGSRDLVFGPAVYRPEHSGYNDAGDVVRLADYLTSIRPENWTAADFPSIAGLPDEEDRAFEIDFAREWLAVLAALYRRSSEKGRVIVLENLG
jgi:hypothetical protein